jgi:DNA (cytosine-5)-methyltransferase 1
MFRLIQECNPQYVIGENVSGIINMGLDAMLLDLESAGYEVETFIIPACAVNAPHRRDRVWVIAHSKQHGLVAMQKSGSTIEAERKEPARKNDPFYVEGANCTAASVVAHNAERANREHNSEQVQRQKLELGEGVGIADIPDTSGERSTNWVSGQVRDSGETREFIHGYFQPTDFRKLTTTEWLLESTFCRGDARISYGLDGVMIPGVTTEKVPNRTSRLQALGNSVVPQLVELIGMAIMAADGD